MKRLFIVLLLSLPAFVSCLVDDADVNYIDSGDLALYAKNKIAETVAVPVEAMELALVLDDYLKLTEEEQAADTIMAPYVEIYGENVYAIRLISDSWYRNIYCEIATGGGSIRDKDARWLISKFIIDGNDPRYSRQSYNFVLPDHSELLAVAPDEGYWSIEGTDLKNLMHMLSREDGLYSWDVVVAESEDTDIGVKSYFGTSGRFTLHETHDRSGEKTNLYTGKFFVEIYRNEDTLIDYCYANFNGTSSSVYVTSRD